MTTAKLDRLLKARADAWDALPDGTPLGSMSEAERARVDELSRIFNDSERAIVDYLKSQPAPVAIDGGIMLHLTADRLGFIELKKATGEPVWMNATKLRRTDWRNWLYRYPAATA